MIGERYTRENRLARALMEQEGAAPPIQSHTQGLASMLRQGLAGYMQGKDQRNMQAAQDAFARGITAERGQYLQPVAEGMQGPPKPLSNIQAAMQELRGVGGNNPHATSALTSLGLMDMQNRQQQEAMQEQRRFDLGLAEDAFDQEKQLAIFNAGLKTESPELVKIVGPDGNPVFVTPEEAAGKQPYISSTTALPASAIQIANELNRRQRELAEAIETSDPQKIKLARSSLENLEFAARNNPNVIKAQADARAVGAESGKARIERAASALDDLGKIASTLGNINEAIAAIDEGANTGPAYNMLPSVTEATIKLENAANKMGLDVIGSVTFGALSEGELQMAMSTAMPRSLNPQDLKEWLVAKRDAQIKLADYLTEASKFLSSPEGSLSGWADMQRRNIQNSQPANTNKTTTTNRTATTTGSDDDEWEPF